ncbi:MAG: hypothetical protein ACOC1K_07090, partial [Nanoarchaeota archaeon]
MNDYFRKKLWKKGFASNTIVDIYAIIAFAIIIIVFFLIFSFSGSDERNAIKEEARGVDDIIVLHHILNTNYEINGESMSFTDVLSVINNENVKNEFRNELEKIVKNAEYENEKGKICKYPLYIKKEDKFFKILKIEPKPYI